ncbi:hypothetical protein EMCRGX_G003023 [Ephydatia muelleri]
MRSNYNTSPVNEDIIPSPEQAVQQYHSLGGQLTIFSHFGTDPLEDGQRAERDERLKANILDFPTIFYKLVNGDDKPFQNGENDICDDGKQIAEAEDWESTVKENRGMGSIGVILLRYRLQEQGEPSLPVFIRQSNQLSICQ